MNSPSRLRRWVLPASFLPLALAAIAFLGMDLIVEADDGFDEPLVTRALPTPAAPAAPRRAAPAEPAPRPRVRQLKRSELPKQIAHAPVPKSERTHRANHLVTLLARKKTLRERLHTLQRYCDKLPPEGAADVLEALLDSQVPGDFYEATNLRLAALGELGALDSPRAEAVLVTRLRADVPRPERIIALELLANRPAGAGTSEIQAIAYNDHDQRVQSKARWALKRQGIEVR